MSSKSDGIRTTLAKYAMRAGEEIKRGMPCLMSEAFKSGCWKDDHKVDGTKFATFTEWLTHPAPHGCGLGTTMDAITCDEIGELCGVQVAEMLGNEPLARIKAHWNRLTRDQRKQFTEWAGGAHGG